MRFQYKACDQDGLTDELRDITVFEPDAEGIVSVWLDPADGCTYIVNGHHRYALASRTGYPSLRCRYLTAATAVEARLLGALVNIREGRGTVLDAAKLLRDTQWGPDDLAAHGISTVRGTLARDAHALGRLHDALFYRVVTGKMDLHRGIVIGRELPAHEQQLGLVELLEAAERGGGKKAVRDFGAGDGGELTELIRFVRAAGTATQTQVDLFGSHVLTASLAVPKAKLSFYIRRQLQDDHRTFAFVGKKRRTVRLEDVGNRLVRGANQRRSVAAVQMLEALQTASGSGSSHDPCACHARSPHDRDAVMTDRTLTIGGRHYAERAATSRFANDNHHCPEITLGGIHLRAMHLQDGSRLVIKKVKRGHLVLRRAGTRTAGRIATVRQRTSGHLQLRLGGVWLSDDGFPIGKQVRVESDSDVIRLTVR